MSEGRRERIIIVGAGLAGALLACLLGEAGYEVVVYERRTDPRKEGIVGGRSINLAISARAIHGLKLAGLDQTILADALGHSLSVCQTLKCSRNSLI